MKRPSGRSARDRQERRDTSLELHSIFQTGCDIGIYDEDGSTNYNLLEESGRDIFRRAEKVSLSGQCSNA